MMINTPDLEYEKITPNNKANETIKKCFFLFFINISINITDRTAIIIG